MKTSTWVAIAVMLGLLILVHIKQVNYEQRVSSKRDGELQANKIEFENHAATKKKSMEDTTTPGPTTTTEIPADDYNSADDDDADYDIDDENDNYDEEDGGNGYDDDENIGDADDNGDADDDDDYDKATGDDDLDNPDGHYDYENANSDDDYAAADDGEKDGDYDEDYDNDENNDGINEFKETDSDGDYDRPDTDYGNEGYDGKQNDEDFDELNDDATDYNENDEDGIGGIIENKTYDDTVDDVDNVAADEKPARNIIYTKTANDRAIHDNTRMLDSKKVENKGIKDDRPVNIDLQGNGNGDLLKDLQPLVQGDLLRRSANEVQQLPRLPNEIANPVLVKTNNILVANDKVNNIADENRNKLSNTDDIGYIRNALKLPVNGGTLQNNLNKVKLSLTPNENNPIEMQIPENRLQGNSLQNSGLNQNVNTGAQDLLLNKQPNNNVVNMNVPVGGQQNIQDIELQKLAEKYPDTLNETMATQTDSYIERLRNKLYQIGRQDIIYKNHCAKRLPNGVIIGVMKAGTEAFSTFLGIHPQVAMQLGYTAMDFFSNSATYSKGEAWYRNRMMCSTRDQVIIEKSPQYFTSSMAPERIYRMDPNMKIIVIVRDPIDRAVSHFLQQQKSHPERLSAPTFEECVYDRTTKQVIANSQYILQSTYSTILKRWLKYFPSRQILIVDGDTFKENPFRSLNKAEKFLDIEYKINENLLRFDEEKGFYCIKANTENSEDSCFQGGKGRAHPPIDPEVEMALREYFKKYNEEFIRLTGMRVDW